MVETFISIGIAGITGFYILNNRLHERINNVHNRISDLATHIDAVELKIAQDYVTKSDLSRMTKRMEDHMVRIEVKIDQIVLHNNNGT